MNDSNFAERYLVRNALKVESVFDIHVPVQQLFCYFLISHFTCNR